MKIKELAHSNRCAKQTLAAIVTICLCCQTGISFAQPAEAVSVPVIEVAKLAQQRLSDEFLLNYVKSSGANYHLTAAEIIYLKNQGVSEGVLNALVQSTPLAPASANTAVENKTSTAPIVPPAASAPPVVSSLAPAPLVANFDSFHEQLSAYGTWIELPRYGKCWQPAAAPGWRPYLDAGHWTYTDNGWYWQSEYAWGDIVFHYGRWHYMSLQGWIWVPGYEFAPAWVFWRRGDSHCGWAPLPPETIFVAGRWEFCGRPVAADFDFGLPVASFSFVAYDHFLAHDFRCHIVPAERVTVIYHQTRIVNNYTIVNNRIVNEGMGREHIARVTGREIKPVSLHEIKAQEERHHTLERQKDREIVRTGGKVDGMRRASAANDNARSVLTLASHENNPGKTTHESPQPARPETRAPIAHQPEEGRENPHASEATTVKQPGKPIPDTRNPPRSVPAVNKPDNRPSGPKLVADHQPKEKRH